MELERLASFYGNGSDELHLAFNFTFLHADLDADVLRRVRRADGGGAPRRGLARVDVVEPRRGALPDPLGRRRRATAPAARCCCS